MGGNVSDSCFSVFSKKPVKVLMVGLEQVGKSTILYQLLQKDLSMVFPTNGFNVETVKHRHLQLQVWDLGYREKLRPLWVHYYQGTQAIIFVVDAHERDPDEIQRTIDEIRSFMNEEQLQDVPILILANKQDLSQAMSTEELTETMNLNAYINKRLHVQQTCGLTGEGVEHGLDWLCDEITRKNRK